MADITVVNTEEFVDRVVQIIRETAPTVVRNTKIKYFVAGYVVARYGPTFLRGMKAGVQQGLINAKAERIINNGGLNTEPRASAGFGFCS